jgi:hypothetical protein
VCPGVLSDSGARLTLRQVFLGTLTEARTVLYAVALSDVHFPSSAEHVGQLCQVLGSVAVHSCLEQPSAEIDAFRQQEAHLERLLKRIPYRFLDEDWLWAELRRAFSDNSYLLAAA